MQVFVSNPTLQHRNLQYRVLEASGVRRVLIRAGGQERLPDDLEGQGLEYVIKQIENAGGAPASDLKSIRSIGSLIYTVSKPTSTAKIDAAAERDGKIRQDVAATQAERAGVAAYNVIEQAARPGALRSTVLEIEQLTDRGDAFQHGGVDFEQRVERSGKRRRNA